MSAAASAGAGIRRARLMVDLDCLRQDLGRLREAVSAEVAEPYRTLYASALLDAYEFAEHVTAVYLQQERSR